MLKALELSPYSYPVTDQPRSWAPRLGQAIRIRTRKFRRPRIIGINGVKLEIDRSRLAPEVIRALYKERYEDREAAIVCAVLAPGDRVLEMGAGIGYISILCAQRCGEHAVLSYEANPDNEALIRRNFALNGLHPQLRCFAVAATSETRALFVEPNMLSTGLIDRGNGQPRPVQCHAIADIIHEFKPNTLVMDVEGSEIDLLPASPLEGISKVILETHARIVGMNAIHALDAHMQSRGFTRFDARSQDKVWLYLRQ